MRVKRIAVVWVLVAAILCLQVNGIKVNAKTGEVAGIRETSAYYIKNVASGLYLEYDLASDNVRVGKFTGADNQRWGFRLKSNGNYVVVPRGNTEYRLDVHSGKATQGANIDICPSTNGKDQEWHGHRNSNGTYMFKSACSDYTRFLAASGVTAGANVVQSTAHPSEQRNWTLERVSKGTAFQAVHKITQAVQGNLDTTGAIGILDKYSKSMGYSPYQLTNTNAATSYGYMNSDIWIFNGHGGKASISFMDIKGASLGRLMAESGQILSNQDRAVGSLAFNSLNTNRCTILLSCESGLSDGSYNLIDTIYSKGAKFALGPTNRRYDIYDNIWLEAFLKASQEKKTVSQALAIADVAAPQSSSYYYRGNVHQKLNP